MSGSFWKFSNGFTSLSNISTLLENYSINQDQGEGLYAKSQEILLKLLDENDILQELLSNNPLLLEFLREDDILGMLVDFVIKEGEVEEEKDDETTDEEKKEDEKKEDETKEPKQEDNEKVKSKDSDDEDNENQDDDNENQEKDDFDDDHIDSIDENDTNDEEDETTEEIATRRATIAAEILSADVWSLTDTVMESTPSLNKLWSILDSKSPMSINLSTYFMKIMEHLLDMKCDEMITYLIENQSNLVEKFMNHLSNPPLMDFLLKLISTDKPDNSTGIIDFLQNQDLITFLIEALDITEDTSAENYDLLLVKQSSAADFLKALITISANSTTDNSTIGPNELTRELVSYEQMNALCNIMLKGGYALANGVGIIIEIIRKNNSDYDILPVLYITLDSHPPTGRDPIYLGHLLKVFGTKIDSFNKLLVNNIESNKLKTPFGEIEPLGFERFKICELVAELLHCSNMALLNDNKGFDVVKERDTLRMKMKEYDPISFKYNEVIVLPSEKEEESSNQEDEEEEEEEKSKAKNDDDDYFNDTIDSFNSKFHQDGDSLVQGQDNEDDEDEPHANANLTEEQIRADPVVGDFLKISLFDTQIISNILTMFFKFPWNNFLHNVVFDIVQQVLNGSMDIGFNKFLAIDLFHLGDITNKIIEGQKLCTGYEDSHNGLRLGFMGHLTLIAEEVVKFIQLYPTNTLSEMIDIKVEDEVWEDYVSHVLYDTREKYNAILGGGEDDDEDDDEEENNTFDEGLGEIIEEVKTGLVFDINTDHDIEGSGYEEKHNEDVDQDEEDQDEVEHDEEDQDEEEDREDDDEDDHKLHKDRLDSDESESDDDDHFTNYMSQQLTNTASTDIATGRTSPDIPEPEFSDADEYIDPNDDGMSYKKSNPLYDASGSLLKPPSDGELEGDLSSEDSSSNSDNDEDIEIDDEQQEVDSSTNKLTRAASKG